MKEIGAASYVYVLLCLGAVNGRLSLAVRMWFLAFEWVGGVRFSLWVGGHPIGARFRPGRILMASLL